ncbi:MAG: hypothetical protein HOC20_06295 [Chloroflexi bacterium]|nr:hypothetical protein [Chloroflexota bacterium]
MIITLGSVTSVGAGLTVGTIPDVAMSEGIGERVFPGVGDNGDSSSFPPQPKTPKTKRERE